MGYAATITQADITFGVDAVRVWHCNAPSCPGSKLDRHEHIGQGNVGVEPFLWLLNDPRFADCAFIAETPVDAEGDEERNVRVLRSLVEAT
jgi:deoxyribonuclease IV